MSLPPAPQFWRDDPEEFDLQSFNSDGFYELPKPYKILLMESEEALYLIQCGTPGSDDPTKFCYVLYNKKTNGAARILSPTSIPAIWDALPFYRSWQRPEKWVDLERLKPVVEDNTKLPPAPIGWNDCPEDIEWRPFDPNGLYDLPKPLKILMMDDYEELNYIVQCGTPGSDDPAEFCYVCYNPVSSGAVRVISPTNVDDLWTALSYWGTNHHREKGVRTESLEPVPSVVRGEW